MACIAIFQLCFIATPLFAAIVLERSGADEFISVTAPSDTHIKTPLEIPICEVNVTVKRPGLGKICFSNTPLSNGSLALNYRLVFEDGEEAECRIAAMGAQHINFGCLTAKLPRTIVGTGFTSTITIHLIVER